MFTFANLSSAAPAADPAVAGASLAAGAAPVAGDDDGDTTISIGGAGGGGTAGVEAQAARSTAAKSGARVMRRPSMPEERRIGSPDARRIAPMSFVAEAHTDIEAPPEVVFDTLLDHPTWKDWMPRSFAVASAADGPHRPGKRFRIRVARAPFASTLELTIADRPREVAWTGGVRGLLHADHRFRLAGDGKGGTHVHSHETWSGALAGVLRPLLKPGAERVGREQLAGLASACRGRKSAVSGESRTV